MTPLAATADPPTSHRAGEELVASGAHAAQCAEVLAALRRHPGTTSAELAKAAGLDRHLCGRRLPDLRRAGTAANGADRRCTVTGKRALTWRAVGQEIQGELF